MRLRHQIYEETPYNTLEIIGEVSGFVATPRTFLVDGRDPMIEFVSDEELTGSGYHVSYRAVPSERNMRLEIAAAR